MRSMTIAAASVALTFAVLAGSASAADTASPKDKPRPKGAAKQTVKAAKPAPEAAEQKAAAKATVPAAGSFAPPDTIPKHDRIRELVLLFESMNNSGRRYVQQILYGLAQERYRVSPEQQAALARELDVFMTERSGREFVDQLVKIYDNQYTESEIDQLLAFYRSPVGRKTMTTGPVIARESIAWAQQYARDNLMPVLEERILKSFPLRVPNPPPVANETKNEGPRQ
jgi:hypothetical protein